MPTIELNPGQAAFWNAQERLRALLGGRGSGKTCVGALEALRMAQERPGKPGLIAGPDYPHLMRGTLPEFEKWAHHAIVDRNKAERWYKLVGGTKVWYASLDDPDAVRGVSVNWLWGDELGVLKTNEAWLVLLACLREPPDPMLWLTTTPRGQTHWLHDVFVKKPTGQHWHGFASTDENAPNLDSEYIDMLRNAYTGSWLRQEMLGQFIMLEGIVFKREWFTLADVLPEGIRWVRFWDLATSVRQTADYTCGAKVGTKDGNIYISDVVRDRWEWPTSRRVIIQTAQMDGTKAQIGIEKVAFQLAAIQELRKEDDLVGYTIKEEVPDKDKLSRALPWASRAEAGQVYLVNGPWVQDFLNEVCDFPQGAHDDQVDAVSGAVQMLAKPRGVYFAIYGGEDDLQRSESQSQERYGKLTRKEYPPGQHPGPWVKRGKLV